MEQMESQQAINNQMDHYNALDLKRKDFLVKINTLNQKIENLDKKGVYSKNYSLQQHKKKVEQEKKVENDFLKIQEVQKLLDTKKNVARELNIQQVNRDVKNQVVEKKTREIHEKKDNIDHEKVQQIVNSIQQTDEFIQAETKRKIQRESLVRDLDELVQGRQVKMLINQVGITNEEITLNKTVLAKMLSSDNAAIISPRLKFTNVLPVVERK